MLLLSLLNRVWLFVTPWTAACKIPCPSLSPRVCSNSCPLSWWYHPTISSCRPLLFLPSIFPSIRVFSRELALLIRWPKYWSFSFSINPSNEYSGLISFRMDWLQSKKAFKRLLYHHNLKATILQCWAFFMVQLSHAYMTTGKKHCFNCTDLCWQWCFCFLIWCRVGS